MDSQRLIIAVVLSLAVLIGWNYFFPQTPPQQPPQSAPAVQQESPLGPDMQEPMAPPLPTQAFEAVSTPEILVDTPLYKGTLSSQGGVVKHFQLKQYKQTLEPDSEQIDLISPDALHMAPMGVLLNGRGTWRDVQWSASEESLILNAGESGTVTLSAMVSGIQVQRVLTFEADSYLISERLTLTNSGSVGSTAKVGFTLAAANLSPDEDRYNQTAVAYLANDSREETAKPSTLAEGLTASQNVQWGGVGNNYFFLAMMPQFEGALFKAKLEDGIYRSAMDRDNITLEPGAQHASEMVYYLGPKLPNEIYLAPNELERALSYGWFDFISKPLLLGINFFYKYTGNYGIAIILLTVVLKILLWPLSHKSYKSMRDMQKLQPMLAKIREKYKDDRQKQQQETMALFKTYKVNPASGCLLMLPQFPIFIGLYQALLKSMELRHAAFITHLPFTDYYWLADLSAKDPFYITPIIMGATMLIQQKMTPTAGDPTQAKIMMLMPIVFTFIFLNFPAGLVVYWLTQNILSIGQQWWMLRRSTN